MRYTLLIGRSENPQHCWFLTGLKSSARAVNMSQEEVESKSKVGREEQGGNKEQKKEDIILKLSNTPVVLFTF